MASSGFLLIAFKFPPYAEVGGKRWAKLAKYLARTGHDVHVLTTGWGPETAESMEDVRHPRIFIHRVPCLGVHRLRTRTFSRSLGGRVANRTRRAFLRLLAVLGLEEDARFWGLTMLPAAAGIIRRHRLTTVVCTGAPFRAGWAAAGLKKTFPGIRLIQEFQDPFADLPSLAAGPQAPRRRAERVERRIIDPADVLVTVTDGLSALIAAKAGGRPVVTIANGFDEEEFSEPAEPVSRACTLLYAGNLFVGRQEPLAALLSSFRRVADEVPEMRMSFYGGFPSGVRRDVRDLEEAGLISIRDRVPTAEIVAEMHEAFACLQLNARQFPYLVSMKIYEYGRAHRPVLSINYGGEIDTLVRDRALGWSVDADRGEDIDAALREIHAVWQERPDFETSPVGLGVYGFESLAQAYARLIDGPLPTRSGGPGA